MARSPTKNTRLALALELVYGFPGKLLHGWEAHPDGDDAFIIHRSNGSTRRVKLNEKIDTVDGDTFVSRSEFGTLAIGDRSVLIGKNLKHGFQARAKGNTGQYVLVDPKGRNLGSVTSGIDSNGSPVSCAGHILQVGEDKYPITPKQHEIQLLVFRTPHENGFLAKINVNEKGNKMNRKDGANGTFVPPSNAGDPAMFYEDFAGHKVLTAQFWLNPQGQSATFHSRDGAVAVEEKRLEKILQGHKETAMLAGIDPAEYHEYCATLAKLEPIKKEWNKSSMVVIEGAEIFKPAQRRQFDIKNPGDFVELITSGLSRD
jgi:hypothetical protein